jgi:hypothetical protein
MVNFLQGKPVNRDATLGAVEEFASQWAGLGGDYRPDMFGGDREDHVHRRAQAGQGATPWWADAAARAANARAGQAPQPDPRAAERIAARQAMGFSPSDVLSEDVIKTRQKKLARKHHPDMGGSVDRMAAINAAADVLIASLYD